MAGFRICGERCVRIDMLERLADTIRDRVFWRPRFPTEARPPGSVEGGGFAIVPDMMSLVGCSGEEFAGILRSLGFRSENRQIDATAPSAAATPDPPQPGSPDPIPPPVPPGVPEPDPASDPAPADPTPAPPQPEEPPPAPPGPDIDPPGPGAPEITPPGPGGPEIPALVLEVWWPRDTGPFRRRKARPGTAKRRSPRRAPKEQPAVAASPATPPVESIASETEAKRPPRPERHKRKQRRGEDGKRRGEDGADERPKRYQAAPRDEQRIADGPFAVLGALREKLAQTKK
jgi:ATP-dependent RNA helicase SUPV3L1/SUV3